MAFSFLKLPRAAQKAAFAHMGDKPHPRKRAPDQGRIAGFVGVLPAPDKPASGGGRFTGELPSPRGRPRGLGSGARHRKLSTKTKASETGQKDTDQQRIDDLRSAYERGHTSGPNLGGGFSADLVQKIELSDGRHAVLKRQSPEEARREYLAGRVANAVGIKGITVAQVSDRDIVMNFVDGDPGAAKIKAAAPNHLSYGESIAAIKAETKRQVRLRNGREIGMLDWLTDNQDRHSLNWMLSPDGQSVTPIDHGRAGFKARMHRREQHLVSQSPFVEEWVRPRTKGDDLQFVSADPQWTPGELAQMRTKLEALRPEFTEDGETRWYDGMMARFDLLEPK